MNYRNLSLAILLFSFLGVNIPAYGQNNWVFGNPSQTSYNYNPSGQTIQYYPPELGVDTRARYRTAPTFHGVPSRIEPNEQPNPLRDELEKTDYV